MPALRWGHPPAHGNKMGPTSARPGAGGVARRTARRATPPTHCTPSSSKAWLSTPPKCGWCMPAPGLAPRDRLIPLPHAQARAAPQPSAAPHLCQRAWGSKGARAHLCDKLARLPLQRLCGLELVRVQDADLVVGVERDAVVRHGAWAVTRHAQPAAHRPVTSRKEARRGSQRRPRGRGRPPTRPAAGVRVRAARRLYFWPCERGAARGQGAGARERVANQQTRIIETCKGRRRA